MRKLLLLLLLPVASIAQDSTNTCGEYHHLYCAKDGTIWWTQNTYSGTGVRQKQVTGVSGIHPLGSKDGGGQYSSLVRDSSFVAYEIGYSGSNQSVTTLAVDTGGNPVYVDKTYMLYRSKLAITTDSLVVYQDNSTDVLNKGTTSEWQYLPMPAGRKCVELTTAANTPAFSDALVRLYMRMSDGTVWYHSRTTTTPVQITYTGTAALRIANAGQSALAIFTATDMISVGRQDSRYLGMASHTTTPTSIKSIWDAAGAVWPYREVVSSANGIAVVDAIGQFVVSGSAVNGEAGDGGEYHTFRTRPSGLGGPWLYNLGQGEMLVGPRIIKGVKLHNVQSGTTLAFYYYGSDDFNQTWVAGRVQKAYVGTVGFSMPEFGANNVGYDNSPNGGKRTSAFVKTVNQKSFTWTITPFDTSSVPLPQSAAGIDHILPVGQLADTLYGENSNVQEIAITAYWWSLDSGPAGSSFTTPAIANTAITGLTTGTYIANLAVTDALGRTANSKVKFQVTESTPVGPTGRRLKWFPKFRKGT